MSLKLVAIVRSIFGGKLQLSDQFLAAVLHREYELSREFHYLRGASFSLVVCVCVLTPRESDTTSPVLPHSPSTSILSLVFRRRLPLPHTPLLPPWPPPHLGPSAYPPRATTHPPCPHQGGLGRRREREREMANGDNQKFPSSSAVEQVGTCSPLTLICGYYAH
jgi:hypothetical protein